MLKSTYAAICLLRDYKIGSISSIEFNPDKVQISKRVYPLRLEFGDDALVMDVTSKREAAWILALRSAKELAKLYNYNQKWQCFWLFYFNGIHEELIAAKGRVKAKTVRKYIFQVEKDFENILIAKGLLEDEESET